APTRRWPDVGTRLERRHRRLSRPRWDRSTDPPRRDRPGERRCHPFLRPAMAQSRTPRLHRHARYRQWPERRVDGGSTMKIWEDDDQVGAEGNGKEHEQYGGGDDYEIEAEPWWRDPATIPPREFLYGRHLVRKDISATIGAGGRAKTTYCLF